MGAARVKHFGGMPAFSRRSVLGAARKRGNIMTRGNHPLNQGAISVDYEVTCISFWTGDEDVYNPTFVYDNWYLDAANGCVEATTDGVNTLTPFTLIDVNIWWSGQPKLYAGVGSVVVGVGDTYITTPMYGVRIPANTQVFVHTVKQHTVGGRRVTQYYPYSGKGEGATFTSSLSNAMTQFDGTVAANDTTVCSGPSMVVCDVSLPAVLAIGDSLFDGSNDNALADIVAGMRTGGDSRFNRGYVSRSIGTLQGCYVHRACRGGAKFEGFTGSAWARRKATYQSLGIPFDRVFLCLGTNNLGEGLPSLTSKADVVLNEIKTAFGKPVYQVGMFPGSSSTDAYATLVNQTRRSNYTEREGLRDYWTAQAASGVLAGFADPSLYISGTGADLWKWLPIGGPTSDDGTHYTALGAPLLADWLWQQFPLVPYPVAAASLWQWPSGADIAWPSGADIEALS
jgi:lysophospholipase L1-like esterase